MKRTALSLLLLCCSLAGCIVVPMGRPWDHGHRDFDHREHAQVWSG